jgi:hypothetical protein
MIKTYIEKIASITKRGDAREESYYPALAAFLEKFSETGAGGNSALYSKSYR